MLNVPHQECMAAEARCRPRPRGVALLEAVILLYFGVPTGHSYNLDPESALLYQGPSGTLFGYSVVLHSHGTKRW